METERGKFQWRATLRIRASLDRVWEIADDISLIPHYHPEVSKVDLLSGTKQRALGVKYRCTISAGRTGSCVEEVIEYEPRHKVATAFPEDTWGLSRMLKGFVVETTVIPQSAQETSLRFEAYYDPVGLRMRFLNALFLRRMMRKRSLRVMEGIRRMAEGL